MQLHEQRHEPAHGPPRPGGAPGVGVAAEVDRFSNEGPQTEVTQQQYLATVGSKPSAFPGDLTRPVEQVSWNDAVAYCAALTTTERTAGRCPADWGYRLPTEAEWEYAARARTGTRFSYGDDPGYTLLTNYAWWSANGGGTTHPVGTKAPNAWGLFDMSGNVWEWCQDWQGAYRRRRHRPAGSWYGLVPRGPRSAQRTPRAS